MKNGRKWAKVSKAMVNRNENAVKNRFHSLFQEIRFFSLAKKWSLLDLAKSDGTKDSLNSEKVKSIADSILQDLEKISKADNIKFYPNSKPFKSLSELNTVNERKKVKKEEQSFTIEQVTDIDEFMKSKCQPNFSLCYADLSSKKLFVLPKETVVKTLPEPNSNNGTFNLVLTKCNSQNGSLFFNDNKSLNLKMESMKGSDNNDSDKEFDFILRNGIFNRDFGNI